MRRQAVACDKGLRSPDVFSLDIAHLFPPLTQCPFMTSLHAPNGEAYRRTHPAPCSSATPTFAVATSWERPESKSLALKERPVQCTLITLITTHNPEPRTSGPSNGPVLRLAAARLPANRKSLSTSSSPESAACTHNLAMEGDSPGRRG